MVFEDLPPTPTVHVIFSIFSAILIQIAAILILSRNKHSKTNQFFFAFLTGVGLHQFFDALMVIGIIILNNNTFANFFKDLSISALIVGLSFGALAVLLIFYGEKILAQNIQIGWWIFTLVFTLLGVLGDYVKTATTSYYYIPGKTRTEIGWIGVLVPVVVFTAIILIYLAMLSIQAVEPALKKRLILMLIGFIFIIAIVMLFDTAFVNPSFAQFISDNIRHFIAHLIAIIGGFILVYAVWNPLKASK